MAILESFMSLVPPETNVIRGGVLCTIPAAELVVGDVVYLGAGNRVPADCRLFYETDLKVDNSSITGESEPIERDTNISTKENPLEANNLSFGGTSVAQGDGYGIVIRTGDDSILGQIAKLTIGETTPKSQLAEEINFFVRILAMVAIITAIIFFIICLVIGYSIGMTFSFAIGIFVAFVPQGLPLTVSTLLTIAAKRMAKRNVLVKNLHAVETLGSITCLATDKTGTLTQNKMTVVGVWLNEQCFSPMEVVGGDHILEANTPNLPALVEACALCTRATYRSGDLEKPLGEREIIADATETGIFHFVETFYDPIPVQGKYPKAFEIPFSSQNKWALTVHHMDNPSSKLTSFIKGAPERVVLKCKYIQVDNQIIPWTEDTTAKFNDAYNHFGSHGRRVIAFARKMLPEDQFDENFVFTRDPCNLPIDGFVFIGFVALMDPPKKGVRKAVAALRTAGVQIVMVTGDHPVTAKALGRQIGLISGDTLEEAALRYQKATDQVCEDEYDAVVVQGDLLYNLTDADWDTILMKKEIIFARTSPKQKLEIVTRLQNKGHIVGVSGDGVNDSPALKKADLGISMNKTGSDVSKEAAAMILLDDNFSSIVSGIAEGRLIFVNLKKSIRYTLTHAIPEIVAFLFFVALAIPLPVNSLLVLLIDLGSELGPALSFAFEPAEGDLMLIPPRKVLCQTKYPVFCDPESNVPVTNLKHPGTLWGVVQKCKGLFTRKGTGDVLVDGDLIGWSLFQGGVIEAIGSYSAYVIALAVASVPLDILVGSASTYWKQDAPDLTLTNGQVANASQQIAINGTAQSSYYAGIVICQLFVLWVCKHRFSYPWGMDMLKNKYSWLGAAIAISVATIVVYVPGLNNVVLQGGPAPFLALLAPLGAGLLLVIYETIRIFLRRHNYFGGVPKRNPNLLELVRTTSSVK